MSEPLSLYELNHLVRQNIEGAFSGRYWVRGELAEGRKAANGHFYGELVERREEGGVIIARARVNCWARTYALVSMDFLSQTGKELTAGLKVMVQVSVTFHEQYGYSLSIQDIDPTYTLGDAAQKRKQIIEQLRKDGLLTANAELPLPLLTQRIAVVSSATAAGYGDFTRQLLENAKGYHFSLQLFPALMQGTGVEQSIINALTQIADEADRWDAVVIIRGGGATTDLSDFDSYPLAACIAQMPLPVITGIGHDRDTTVLDSVAHISLKTPTAVAAFLLERADRLADLLASLQQRIAVAAQQHLLVQNRRMDELLRRIPLAAQRNLSAQNRRLDDLVHRMPLCVSRLTARHTNYLDRLSGQMSSALRMYMQLRRHGLNLISTRLEALDPTLPLARGYSITTCQGRLVRSIDDIAAGDVLTTRLKDGTITSEISSWKKN